MGGLVSWKSAEIIRGHQFGDNLKSKKEAGQPASPTAPLL